MIVGRLKGAHKVNLLETTALLTYFEDDHFSEKCIFKKYIFCQNIYWKRQSIKRLLFGKVLQEYYSGKYHKTTIRQSIKRLLFGKVLENYCSAVLKIFLKVRGILPQKITKGT